MLDISLERMLELPPSDQLQARADRVREALATLPLMDSPQRRALERDLSSLAIKQDWAMQRDMLQALRPDGCWCLGLGGKSPRYLPPPPGADEPVRLWDHYCECHDGQAAAVADTVAWEAYQGERQRQRLRRQFVDAGLPSHYCDYSFATYPASPETAEALRLVKAWAANLESRKSLLLHGPFGTGKTGLAAAALSYRLPHLPGGAIFITVPDLLSRIKATYNAVTHTPGATEDALLAVIRTVPLAVLDDLGAERPTDWVQEKMFQIINARHDEMMPTIFTSNLAPSALITHLGERTAWRIIEMSDAVQLNGPNLRAA